MYSNDDDEYNSEGEEDVQEERSFNPAFVVIAIDTHPVMFKKREDGSSPFKDCLDACYTLADSLIFAGGRGRWSQFSVLLAREDSPVLTEFQANLLDTVKLLKEKTKMSEQQLADEYQRKGDFDLASFFLTCKKVFHDIKSAFYKRTLIYITDDDDPVPDAKKRFTALNEVKTFSGNQIGFQVIPTIRNFDYTKFYNELFSLMDSPPIEEICEDKEGLIEKLTSTIVMRHYQSKMLFYPFKGDMTRYMECFKLSVIHSSALLNTRVTKDGKSIKRITEGTSNPSFAFKSTFIGREKIKFDQYEVNGLLNSTLPRGLTLLYVSKRHNDVGYVLHKPYLLRQNEKDELPFFKRFWRYCLDNEKVLVCAQKLRQPGKVRYVELVPVNVNNSPMFLVKYIPFTTEIVNARKFHYPEQDVTDVKKKEAIKKLVDDLTFDFNVKMIPDPCYRKKQAYVKAKLLDEPMEEVEDITLDDDAMDIYLKDAVNMINTNYVLVEEKKRKAPAKGARAKKAK